MSADIKTKKTRTGVVVSNRMNKSIIVQIERIIRHKLYGKYIRRHVKYMVNDPDNNCNIGDVVKIEECRPMSKRKRWRVREIIERAV